jgi:ABC-type proline/glycine betaine transport system ATPase subunit
LGRPGITSSATTLRCEVICTRTPCCTPDLEEALRIGAHIAILRDGELVQVGTPKQIVEQPTDDYVRRFVERRA